MLACTVGTCVDCHVLLFRCHPETADNNLMIKETINDKNLKPVATANRA